MWQGLRQRRVLIALAGAMVCGGIAVIGGIVAADARDNRAPARPRATRPAIDQNLMRGFDLDARRVEDGRFVVPLPAGSKAVLTLDPALQQFVEQLYARYSVPFGSLVAMDPRTGRVLAYVSHSSANPSAPDLALDPTPPAASVFKIVTGAALLDAGATPDTRVCYHGGFSALGANDLVDDPHRDHLCATLADAMGGSINTIFAKLALARLSPQVLARYASAFGFGQALPFDLPTQPSPTEVPAERLEFARTSAGFWHNHMSPLHGALIAATIANAGQMPRAGMVDRVVDRNGAVLAHFEPGTYRSVVGASTAHAVNMMMRRTVTDGTARRTFHDPAGVPFLPGIAVAGKTGTLNGSNPFRGYTWWVGFAPADHPTIAVAALVVNTPLWQIKASFAAREALRFHLVERPQQIAAQARGGRTETAAAAAPPASPPPLGELGLSAAADDEAQEAPARTTSL